MLTLHGRGYARPAGHLKFSPNGNSHSLSLVLPKYLHNPQTYTLPEIDTSLKYTVLIDNGIDDETTTYLQFFPGAKTLKLCYSDHSWPIVARTMIEKAMVSDLSTQVGVDERWPSDEDWAMREKYFLYLRDHEFRYKWKPSDGCDNFVIDDLLNYNTFLDRLTSFGVGDTFRDEWQAWMKFNSQYIDPVENANAIMSALDNGRNIDLAITDLWTHSVINYYIWVKYGLEVPANDYSCWFTNTKQIVKMLNDHGVTV